jgi:hypothetical protein
MEFNDMDQPVQLWEIELEWMEQEKENPWNAWVDYGGEG